MGESFRMKNLLEAAKVEEVKERIAKLRPDSERLWGSMSAAQMVAHCSAGLELAAGDRRPPRVLMGRILGWIIKPMALRNDEPMRRNAPTMIAVKDERELGAERERLCGLIDRFATAGPEGCTMYPHSFFGRLTAEEWATLMYKHLGHHLRQFGVLVPGGEGRCRCGAPTPENPEWGTGWRPATSRA
jgi:Protein of unknown function (DUF1569)